MVAPINMHSFLFITCTCFLGHFSSWLPMRTSSLVVPKAAISTARRWVHLSWQLETCQVYLQSESQKLTYYPLLHRLSKTCDVVSETAILGKLTLANIDSVIQDLHRLGCRRKVGYLGLCIFCTYYAVWKSSYFILHYNFALTPILIEEPQKKRQRSR